MVETFELPVWKWVNYREEIGIGNKQMIWTMEIPYNLRDEFG